jgi:ADP-heptose:LPS heptosyltransferase
MDGSGGSGDLKRILVAKLRPLGDSILAGNCFEAIRKAFPKAWITALLQPPAQELYRHSVWVNEILAYHRGSIDRQNFLTRYLKNRQLVTALKKRRFDLAIDLSAAHRSAHLISRAKPGWMIGLGLPPIKSFYQMAARGDDELKVPAVELDRRILNLIDLSPEPHDRPDGYFPVPQEAKDYADTFWKASRFEVQDPVVAINPFASCVSKEWYPDQWAALIQKMTKHGLKLFATCAPLEKPGLDRIFKILGKTLPTYAGSKVTPLMGLYQKSLVVVSVDSGPRHLAAAVGTPTLTLWGPELVNRWHPYGVTRHPVVLKEVACRPCGLSVCVEKKHECMKTLEPEQVLGALRQLLKRTVVF